MTSSLSRIKTKQMNIRNNLINDDMMDRVAIYAKKAKYKKE